MKVRILPDGDRGGGGPDGSARTAQSNVLRFCQALLEHRLANIVVPGERHGPIFSGLCQQPDVSGNLVQDAWFAALAIESGCEWVTADRDYARFAGLPWRVPF